MLELHTPNAALTAGYLTGTQQLGSLGMLVGLLGGQVDSSSVTALDAQARSWRLGGPRAVALLADATDLQMCMLVPAPSHLLIPPLHACAGRAPPHRLPGCRRARACSHRFARRITLSLACPCRRRGDLWRCGARCCHQEEQPYRSYSG